MKLPVLIASLGLFRLICLHCIFWSESSLVTHKCLCSAIFVQGWGWRKAAWGIFEKTHSSSHVMVKLWSDLTLVHWRWDERGGESKRYEIKWKWRMKITILKHNCNCFLCFVLGGFLVLVPMISIYIDGCAFLAGFSYNTNLSTII